MEPSRPVEISEAPQPSEMRQPVAAPLTREDCFRAFSDVSPIGMFLADVQSRCLYTNRTWQQITGLTLEESLGDGWARSIHPDEREQVLAEWNRWTREGKEFSHEFRLRRPAGEIRWVRARVATVRSDEGQVIGFASTHEDITEFKRREEALRRALDRSQSIVEAAPDAIVTLESDGCISLVNTQTERMFGYRREELLGSPVEVLMAERFRDAHRSHRARYLAAPATRPMGAGLELFARRKDGSEFPVEISLSPLDTEAGISVVSAIRDITDRKRLEAENVRLLQTTQERSEQLQLAIQEAHHRIKNNLQAVSNLFYLASDNTVEPEARKTLQESIDRIQAIALVHDLLSQEEGIQTVDLRSVVERLVPMVIRNHGYGGEAVAVTLDVPPTTVSSKMATSLTLILNELTVNAAKHAFSVRGGGRLMVRLSSADEGHYLSVQDDGPGLPPDFELATHANLGLTVVQTLVERDLDGQFRLANGPGLLAEVWYPDP